MVGKKLGAVRVTMAGAGAAGTAVLRLLLASGAASVIVCDDRGAVHAAGVVSPAELGPHYIIPSVFHPDVASAVAAAVRDAAGGRPSRS